MAIKDPITETLKETRIKRGLSVLELAEVLDIPADRIYKWDQGKSAPKFEDRAKVDKWLAGKNFQQEKPVEPKKGQQNSLGQVPAEELIQVLKEHNEFLRRNFELSLTGISVQAASILAYVSTSLELDNEREAAGNADKLQQLKSDTGRRIGEKMVVGQKMDMKTVNK